MSALAHFSPPASTLVRWPRWRDRWHRAPLRLRQARSTDFPALAILQEEGLRLYSESFFPWDERAFERDFAAGEGRVLETRQELAGFYLIQCRRSQGHLFLAELHVHPRFRNHGLGELLVRCALAEAKAEWLPLRLWVLRNNPARHLYQRLGFTDVGEGSCHHIMERQPDGATVRIQTPANGPELSPMRSTLAPNRSSNETYKFVIGLPR